MKNKIYKEMSDGLRKYSRGVAFGRLLEKEAQLSFLEHEIKILEASKVHLCECIDKLNTEIEECSE